MRPIDDLDVSGKRVFVRADLNVPLDGDRISDDGRIRAALPTIRALSERGARVIVAAHLGRPKGEPDTRYSLRPVAARLGELLGTDVAFATDTAGESARATSEALTDSQVALLENVRFESGETSKDDAERGELADRFAQLADLYVGDAFGAVHRKHASVYDLPGELPHAVGGLVLTEIEVLEKLTTDPQRPYAVEIGRASCRQRVENQEDAPSTQKKTNKQ